MIKQTLTRMARTISKDFSHTAVVRWNASRGQGELHCPKPSRSFTRGPQPQISI